MSGLRWTYLGLAIIGAIWPMSHLLSWLLSDGENLRTMFAAWTANPAVTGLSVDLLVSGAALTIWILAETLVRRNWSALWAIPATFLIGVSCGLPLYLFLRTRPIP
ncbi:MAG: K+-transporting ATPase, A chain [Rhodobacterales bacterium]|nr:MAG: K+-transporting ATPase, A chain [Rhodobacterales bacterium]